MKGAIHGLVCNAKANIFSIRVAKYAVVVCLLLRIFFCVMYKTSNMIDNHFVVPSDPSSATASQSDRSITLGWTHTNGNVDGFIGNCVPPIGKFIELLK